MVNTESKVPVLSDDEPKLKTTARTNEHPGMSVADPPDAVTVLVWVPTDELPAPPPAGPEAKVVVPLAVEVGAPWRH